jgi:hypothetical protein
MSYYRLYLLAGDHHIDSFHDFNADSDEAATAAAEPWLGVRSMELWCGSRLVRQWHRPLLD